jgi:hypothetical protein
MVWGRMQASASTVASWSTICGGTPLCRAASLRHATKARRSSSSASGHPAGVRRPRGRPDRAADSRSAAR